MFSKLIKKTYLSFKKVTKISFSREKNAAKDKEKGKRNKDPKRIEENAFDENIANGTFMIDHSSGNFMNLEHLLLLSSFHPPNQINFYLRNRILYEVLVLV